MKELFLMNCPEVDDLGQQMEFSLKGLSLEGTCGNWARL